MAQTKPKASQFYGVSGDGTAGQVLISDGNGGMSWGANTENYTVSWATPTGQSLTYTQPNPQSSSGGPGSAFPTTTFTATKSGEEISGTATIAGLPTGITASQSISGTGADNVLTVTLTGVFPGADSLNTALTISGLTVQVPPVPLTVKYLVVAGGGSGGANSNSGGGGAGGYRTNFGGTGVSLSAATNYLVTIGAGGAGEGPQPSPGNGNNGINSVFNNITSTGGGRGSGQGGTAASGGSGGGGAYDTNGNSGNAGGYSPVEGYAGANGTPSFSYPGGGGGGASETGNTDGAGHGGDGTSNSITGSAVFYAGGGSGGVSAGYSIIPGGDGGGGAGSNNTATSQAGTANTGGGSGGGAGSYGSGNGGSGIVILRYPDVYTISGLSGTTTTVGSDKVTTFTNAGTGNIQFNS
mgnify:CR=1 FL=1|jgi:hypothetical protein